MKIKFIVKHYETIGDGQWSASPSIIEEAFDVSVIISEGELNDTFSFKLPNPRNVYSDTFNQQDNIQIHYSINGAIPSDDNLLVNGLVKQVESRNESKGKYIMIKGVSFSEISTNALVFHTNTNVDSMQFLEGALQSVTLRNKGFGVTWNLDNPSLKSDEVTAFPKINGGETVKEYDKSLNSILNKYLSNQYTGDGNYYWFINNNKELVIRPRTTTTSFDVVEGVDFRTNRVTISEDIKNFIIVKCGDDVEGRPISTRYDDPISRSKYGFKYYLLAKTNIAPDLITEQKFPEGEKYPSSYSYLTTWGVTVNSDSEWNQAVRDEARRRGVIEGKTFASLRSKGLINISMNFIPNLSYSIGDVLNLSIPSYDISNLSVRIKVIKYGIDGVDIDAYEEVVV